MFENARTKGLQALLIAIVLAFSFSIVNCGGVNKETRYSQNKSKDAKQTLTYEEWVELVGKEKADALYAGIGQEGLDLLTYGAGVSNVVDLLNAITDVNKLITLVGNDYAGTGLGAWRILALLNEIDAQNQTNTYQAAPPADQDTVQKLADFVNGIPAGDLDAKVVGLMDQLTTRDFSNEPTDSTNITKMAVLIAHIGDLNVVIDVLDNMSAANITTKLRDVVLGVNDPEYLVEVMDQITDSTKLVYVLEQVASVTALITLINDVADRTKLGDMINETEDATTWTDQVNGPWTWNTGTITPAGADSTMVRLVALLDGLNGGVNAYDPDSLVCIIDGVTDMTKMVRLVQDLDTNQDLIDLVQLLPDPGVDNVPCQNLGYILENMALTSIPRMRVLVDGQRAFTNVGVQATYLQKLVDLVTALDNVQEGPLKVAQMVDAISTFNSMDNLIDLVYDVTTLSNVSDVINGIYPASNASPQDNSVNTMAYLVENVADSAKLVSMLDNITPANVATLVDSVACVSQAADGSTNNSDCATADGTMDDMDAAGKKLAAVVDNTTGIRNLNFIVNNVSAISQMADLLNALQIASASKVATLINDVDSDADDTTNDWDSTAGNRGTAPTSTDMGRMVNLVDYVSDLTEVAALIDGITAADKLSSLVNDVADSSDLVGLVNSVIASAEASTTDMVNLMNNIDGPSDGAADDIPKLVAIVDDIAGATEGAGSTTSSGDHDLIAALLAPTSGATMVGDPATGGVGYANMATLIDNLADVAAAQRLASVMLGLNANLIYNDSVANVTREIALERIIHYGALYELPAPDVDFPGLGPVHLGTMMNNASDANDLVTLMNSLNITDVVVMVGCGDHVMDTPYEFNPPCTTIGQGW